MPLPAYQRLPCSAYRQGHPESRVHLRPEEHWIELSSSKSVIYSKLISKEHRGMNLACATLHGLWLVIKDKACSKS